MMHSDNGRPLTHDDRGNYLQDLKEYRELLRANRDTFDKVKLRLAGNVNLEIIVPSLVLTLASEGIEADCHTTPFDNWIQASISGDQRADVWVVWLSSVGATNGLTRDFTLDISSTSEAVRRLVEGGSEVIVILPEMTEAEFEPCSSMNSKRRELTSQLIEALPSECLKLSIDHLVAEFGLAKWSAMRFWETAKFPCHPDAVSAVAADIGLVIARVRRPKIRAVVVDLDDTLWGGIVGEVGPGGLQLDPAASGRAYIEMQQFLRSLSDRGVMLAIASKNDASEAVRPFRECPEMVLRENDFVSIKAAWNPKTQSVREILTQINVAPDTVCFLDDSPFERDQIRASFPTMVVPDLSPDPALRVKQLRLSRLFVYPRVNEEDHLRKRFLQRPQIQSFEASELTTYLKGLEMRVHCQRIDNRNLDRATALLSKTNQFNLSLWRPSSRELLQFAEGVNHYAFCFRLTDRLGDGGITCVILARFTGDRTSIVNWVVSCRVFSRGFEFACLDHLVQHSAKLRSNFIDANFVAGPRNSMVENTLTELGFSKLQGDGFTHSVSMHEIRMPNYHLSIEDNE